MVKIINDLSSTSGFMVSVTNTGFWLGVIMVNQIGPILASSRLNISGTLLLFSVVTFAMLLFVLLFVPETKVSKDC